MEEPVTAGELKAQFDGKFDADWKEHIGHAVDVLVLTLKDPDAKERIVVANICRNCHRLVAFVMVPADYMALDKITELKKEG